MDLRQVTDALVYNSEGQQQLGLVEEFDLPDVGSTEVEHKTLGQVVVLDVPGRPLEKLRGKLKLHHIDKDVERTFMNPTVLHTWQLHQRVDVFGPSGYDREESHRVVTVVGFFVMKRPGLTSKLGEQVMPDYELSIAYFRQFADNENEDIVLIDTFNQIYRVNGEDVWKV